MKQLEIFARDEALQRVLDNAGEDWRQAAEMIVARDLAGQYATGEDMRLACEWLGIVPHHPNAWGGFVQGLIKRGAIIPTKKFAQMRSPGSHARMTRIYIVPR